MNYYLKNTIAGILGTTIMSILIFLSENINLPRLPVWEIISEKTNTPIIIGWLIHFLIGIFFAFIFSLFSRKEFYKINISTGMIFGFTIFIFVQTLSITTSGIKENQLLLALGSAIGHIIYGAVIGFFLQTKDKSL